jgi:zinc/manganese transport system substrate-binding protein
MMRKNIGTLPRIGLSVLVLAVCFVTQAPPAMGAGPAGKQTIVVTYSIFGAVVRDLVGDKGTVLIPMPNGQDPHEWEPSAKNVATINKASLIVQNGLGLEGGMEKSLAQAKKAGVKFFTASDHITVRRVGPGEGIPSGDPDQAVGAKDPHLWMDPTAMRTVELALAARLKADLGIDVSGRAKDLATRLDHLDQEVRQAVAQVPEANRRLVTGHESMGYFAQRYGFQLVGAIIPSLTSQAQVSAAELAKLKQAIQQHPVKAIFTELGTSRAVADAIGRETGVRVVELTTHTLPADGSYFTFMHELARVITDALK